MSAEFQFKPNLESAPAYRANYDAVFRKKAKCRDCGAEVLQKDLIDGVCKTCQKPLETP